MLHLYPGGVEPQRSEKVDVIAGLQTGYGGDNTALSQFFFGFIWPYPRH
jgi:hypothetical protein